MYKPDYLIIGHRFPNTIASENHELIILGKHFSLKVWNSYDLLFLLTKFGVFLVFEITNATREV
jgi:hypothetical protein